MARDEGQQWDNKSMINEQGSDSEGTMQGDDYEAEHYQQQQADPSNDYNIRYYESHDDPRAAFYAGVPKDGQPSTNTKKKRRDEKGEGIEDDKPKMKKKHRKPEDKNKKDKKDRPTREENDYKKDKKDKSKSGRTML